MDIVHLGWQTFEVSRFFAFNINIAYVSRLPPGYAQALQEGKDGIMLVTMLEYIRQLSETWRFVGFRGEVGASPCGYHGKPMVIAKLQY